MTENLSELEGSIGALIDGTKFYTGKGDYSIFLLYFIFIFALVTITTFGIFFYKKIIKKGVIGDGK